MSDSGGKIDWERVRSRLRDSQRALDRALGADADDLAAVYRARAARLAARRAQAEAPSTAVRVLVFLLGEERYALEFADLQELLPFAGCAPVPGGPGPLLGVVNVHGDIRSVVDLGRLLELPNRAAVEGGYVLLVRKGGRAAALRVDRIDRIASVEPGGVTAAEAGAASPLLRGLTADRLRFLDTAAVLGHNVFGAAPR